MKIVIVLLALSTIVAVFAAPGIEKEVTPDSLVSFRWTKGADIFFLIAFTLPQQEYDNEKNKRTDVFTTKHKVCSGIFPLSLLKDTK